MDPHAEPQRDDNANRGRRVAFFEQLVQSGKADSFAHYALALEYQKLDQIEQAIATFEALRARDPDYLPMYLLAGRLFSRVGQQARAKDWYDAGLRLARDRGDTKAFGELSEALAELQ